jgi:4-amino-4-deoxy-L-arabinose transferase-like glycosyltransferase
MSPNYLRKIAAKLDLSIHDRIAILLIAIFALMIFIAGAIYHPMPDPQFTERDGFISHADEIRQGRLPRDVFRPLLYPILSAAAGTFFDDSFKGGQFISQVCAVLLLIFSYLLAAKVFNKLVALAVLILLAVHPLVFWNGVYATTEMTFTAFCVITLYFLVSLVEECSKKNLVLTALFFSLAYFTRYTAAALVPVIVTGIILAAAPSKDKKKIAAYVLLFFVLSALFLLPHFIITTINFGSPFYNENYRNIAYKLYGRNDWQMLFKLPFKSLGEVISKDPGKFISSGLKEFSRFLFSSTGQLAAILPVSPWLFSVLFLLGSLSLIPGLMPMPAKKKKHASPIVPRNRNKARLMIPLFVLSYGLLISITFIANRRISFPVLPFLFMLIAYFIYRLIAYTPSFKHSPIAGYILLVVLLVPFGLQVKNLSATMKQIHERLPLAEVQAAVRLQEKYGTGIRVGYTTTFFPRHVDYTCIDLGGTFDRPRNLNRYFKKLRRFIVKHKIDFIIVGRIGLYRRPKQLLFNKDLPSFLQAIEVTGDYAIYRVEIKKGNISRKRGT